MEIAEPIAKPVTDYAQADRPTMTVRDSGSPLANP